MKMSFSSILEKPVFDSKIKSANVETKEKVLGLLVGPAAAVVFNTVLTTYLNLYYTDVLGSKARLGMWAGWGIFLTVLPIVSKILDAITNLMMGAKIDRTHTRQGKLRPYILLAAPLMTITGIMLFAVPRIGITGQIIWIIVSYNLFYSVAYTIYNVSHQLIPANTTRDSLQRTSISVFARIPNMIFAGIIGTVLFPMFIYPIMQRNEMNWIIVMSIISILILPMTLIEYFFTRERVTEEEAQMKTEIKDALSISKQLGILVKEPVWVCFLLVVFLGELANNIGNTSMTYFCNWVLAPDFTLGGAMAGVVNMIGGMPGMLGAFLAIPLAKKLGRENTLKYGLLVSIFGNVLCIFMHTSMLGVCVGKFLQLLGLTGNTYLIMSIMADTIDYCELKHNFRATGLTGSIMSIFTTLCAGLATGIINGVLAASGYQSPADLLQADGSYAKQSGSVETALIFLTFGTGIILYIIMFLAMNVVKVEAKSAQTTATLMERKKKEVEASGGVWEDPVEKAKKERQAIEDKKEAEKLARMKEKCERSGKSYEEALKKYEARKANQAKYDTAKLILLIIGMLALSVVAMKGQGLL